MAVVIGLSDFVLSNFANANFLKIVVLTQYKSHSLDRHISQTWQFTSMLGSYVTPVPAQMRRGPQWFSGSADAIYQNLNLVSDERPDVVCVFGADHVYHMDPRQIVEEHLDTGAGVTVAGIPIPMADAADFGVMEVPPRGASSSSTRSRRTHPVCRATRLALWRRWGTTSSIPRC